MPMTFENKEYLKLKETKDDEFSDLIGGILVSGETIVHTYKSVRDGIVFTNKRLIAIDIDSELYLWFAGMGEVKFEFTARTDVSRICRCISECILD